MGSRRIHGGIRHWRIGDRHLFGVKLKLKVDRESRKGRKVINLLNNNPIARLFIQILLMPIIFGLIAFIGFQNMTDAHMIDKVKHLDELETISLASIPVIQKNILILDDRIDMISVDAAQDDVRLSHLEQSIIKLERIHETQNNEFEKMFSILERIERKTQ